MGIQNLQNIYVPGMAGEIFSEVVRSIQFWWNFCASFQPDGVGAPMRRVYSATIGLLNESHRIVPHHLKVPQTQLLPPRE